jgi:hypothetical protein
VREHLSSVILITSQSCLCVPASPTLNSTSLFPPSDLYTTDSRCNMSPDVWAGSLVYQPELTKDVGSWDYHWRLCSSATFCKARTGRSPSEGQRLLPCNCCGSGRCAPPEHTIDWRPSWRGSPPTSPGTHAIPGTPEAQLGQRMPCRATEWQSDTHRRSLCILSSGEELTTAPQQSTLASNVITRMRTSIASPARNAPYMELSATGQSGCPASPYLAAATRMKSRAKSARSSIWTSRTGYCPRRGAWRRRRCGRRGRGACASSHARYSARHRAVANACYDGAAGTGGRHAARDSPTSAPACVRSSYRAGAVLDTMARQMAAGYRTAGPLMAGLSGGGAEGIGLHPQARRVHHAQQVLIGVRAPGPLVTTPPAGVLLPVSSFAPLLYGGGTPAAEVAISPPAGPPPPLYTTA